MTESLTPAILERLLKLREESGTAGTASFWDFRNELEVAAPALLDEVGRQQERIRRLEEALRRFVNGMETGGLIGCSEDWQSEINQARAAFEKDMD